MRGSELGQEGVELAGGDAGVPRLERKLEGRDQLLHVATGLGRDVHPRGPGNVGQVLLDLTLQVAATVVVDLVPLVEGEHERTAVRGW